MERYIKVEANYEQEEKLKKFMDKLGLEYTMSFSPPRIFYSDEAQYFLDEWEIKEGKELDESLKNRKELIDEIRDALVEDNYILNNERIEEVAMKVINNYLDCYKDCIYEFEGYGEISVDMPIV